MNTPAERLHKYAGRLQSVHADLGYVTRSAIERDLFITSKRLARDLYGYNLRSFTLESHEEIVQCQARVPAPLDTRETILRAFQLKATLANLASGDGYLTWDLLGASLPGRDAAMRQFAKELHDYALRVATLDPG